MIKKKIIVVTGGLGYIGASFCDYLSKKNINFLIIDDYSSAINKNFFKSKVIIKSDFALSKTYENIHKYYEIDCIFHFAAKIDVVEGETNKKLYNSVNFLKNKKLIEIVNKLNIKKLFFASSAAVYGYNKISKIYNEKNILKPINFYGQTKKKSEELFINYFKRRNNSKLIIFRIFNVAGVNENKNLKNNKNNSIFNMIYHNLKIRKKLVFNIYGRNFNTSDGTAVRDYIDINNLVKIFYLSYCNIDKVNNFEIFNCCSSTAVTNLQFINSFNKKLKSLNKKIIIKYKEPRLSEVPFMLGSNLKLLSFLRKKKMRFNSIDRISSLMCKNIL